MRTFHPELRHDGVDEGIPRARLLPRLDQLAVPLPTDLTTSRVALRETDHSAHQLRSNKEADAYLHPVEVRRPRAAQVEKLPPEQLYGIHDGSLLCCEVDTVHSGVKQYLAVQRHRRLSVGLSPHNSVQRMVKLGWRQRPKFQVRGKHLCD